MRPIAAPLSAGRRLAVIAAAFVIAILSCGRETTAPGGATVRYARGLSFNAVFPAPLAQAGGGVTGIVAFNRVRIVLRHTDGSPALDTVIDFPAGRDSIAIALTVQLAPGAPASGEQMTLTLDYLNAAGDTVFHGGPVTVNAAAASTGSPPPPPITVPVSYTGPGSNAAAVHITPRSLTVTAGDGFTFTATAVTGSGTPIPNTPIIWASLDPSRATITTISVGAGVALNTRGTARIIAQLLTGPADTASVLVQPRPSSLAIQSGSGQATIVGALLGQPLVVSVTAADGLGVSGVPVTFAVTGGGGSVAASSVTTDANGLAQTTWRLGAALGAQAVSASVSGLAPVTFSATAQAGPAAKLAFTTQPLSAAAGSTLAAVVVTAQDAGGNVATSFTGAVTVALGGGDAGATLGGTVTVNAIAGVATFSTLTVNRAAAAYTLAASATGLTGATSQAFDVVAGSANRLVFTSAVGNTTAGVAITPPMAVVAQDALGNTVTTFSGAVQLTLVVNPGTAVLSGTTTVNAVAGVATFPGISLNRAGVGYVLLATGTGLTAGASTPFNVAAGPAALLALVSGGGQQGSVLTALAKPIVIQVTDLSGNGVAGTAVTFAVTAGGGSVNPTSATSDAAGMVSTTWTVGPAAGAQAMTASGAGLAPNPLTATATAVGAGPAASLVFSTQPAAAVAGVAVAPAIVVTAKDALGAVATSFTGNVTLAIGANPGGATLGGTMTVAAVAGVATFGNISLDKAGTGYTLTATSGTLGPLTSTAFNITAAAAKTITLSAGNAQAGAPSAALPTPLAVLVTDAFGNPASGQSVTWAAATGGGSVSAPTSSTNAAGIATITWTLGATPGPQTATATATGLTGSPITFTANAVVVGFSKQWTGATSTLWSVAANWAPSGAPAATDSVLIPALTAQPTLDVASATVKHLNLSIGATLNLGTNSLTVTGNLSNAGLVTGSGTMVLSAAAGTLSGVFTTANFNIVGVYTLAGATTLTGPLNIDTGGQLVVNGHALVVNGALATLNGSGTLKMTNPADVVTVSGAASFNGGSESSLLTAGTLLIAGNLSQGTTASAFIASGTHQTVLDGTTAQTVTFANAGQSAFQALTVGNSAGVTLGSSIATGGNLTIAAGTLNGGSTFAATIGGTLTDPLGGLQVSAVSFSGSAMPVSASTPNIIVPNAVTFNSPATLAANLTVDGGVNVNGPGNLQFAGYRLTVNGSFGTVNGGTVTMTGANDTLTVNGAVSFGGGSELGLLTNGTLKFTGNFTQTNAGSGAEFNATFPHKTVLIGLLPQTISFATPDSTPSGGCTLSCFGDFVINKGGGTVTYLTSAHHHGTMVIKAGVLSVNAIGASGSPRLITVRDSAVTTAATGLIHFTRLRTKGNIAFGGTTTVDTIGFDGAGTQNIPAGTYGTVMIGGTPTLGGSLVTTGDLDVSGSLVLGGNNVTVGGGLKTFVATSPVAGSGTITMTNGLDSLTVAGAASFGGASETGLLTAGKLVVGGNFTASGTLFDATAAHTTILNGTAAQSISWTSPVGAFGNLVITGSVNLTTAAVVAGNVDVIMAASLTSSTGYGRLKVAGNVIARPGSVAAGGSITPKVVELAGILADSGSFSPDTAIFTGGATTPQIIPDTVMTGVGPAYKSIRITGSAKMEPTGGRTQGGYFLTGGLVIDGTGKLNIDTVTTSSTISIGDSLVTRGSGAFNMTNGGTNVTVSGNALFAGGASTLSAGTLTLDRNFSQSGATNSFFASGTHKTVFNGAGDSVTFASPTASQFQDATVNPAKTMWLFSNVTVAGTLAQGGGTGNTAISAPSPGTTWLLTASGLNMPGIYPSSFNNVALKFVEGTANASLANSSFTSFPASYGGVVFEVARTTGGPFSFTNLNFSTISLSSAGRYLRNSGTQAITLVTPLPGAQVINVGWDKPGGGTVTWP